MIPKQALKYHPKNREACKEQGLNGETGRGRIVLSWKAEEEKI